MTKQKILLATFSLIAILLFAINPVSADKGLSIVTDTNGTENFFYGRSTGAMESGTSYVLFEDSAFNDMFRINGTGDIYGRRLCDETGANCHDISSGWSSLSGSDNYIGDASAHTAGGALNMNGQNLTGVNQLTFNQGVNYRIGTNSSGLLFDGGDGNWDFLVYDDRIYGQELRLGYSGSALITTNDTNENLDIIPNGLGTVNILANVAIGTNAPSSLFHVKNGDLMIENDAATGGTGVARLLFSEGAPTAQMRIEYDGDNEGGDANRLSIVSDKNDNAVLTVTYGEQVGIGTTNPGSTLDVSGSVRGNYDTNNTSYFGRTAIGYCSYSDYACISHVDRASAGNYALLQNSNGSTYLNASGGRDLLFRINNVTQMTMNTSIFDVVPAIRANSDIILNTPQSSSATALRIKPVDTQYSDLHDFIEWQYASSQGYEMFLSANYGMNLNTYFGPIILDSSFGIDFKDLGSDIASINPAGFSTVGNIRSAGSDQTEARISLSTNGGYTEIAQRSWAGSDAILFSAYASDTYVDGGINAFGNTKHKYNASQFGSSDHRAKAIATDHNRIRFLISSASPGADQNVDWATKMNIGESLTEIITPTINLADLGSTYSEYVDVNIGGGPGSGTNLNMMAGEWNNINFSGTTGGTPPAAIQYSIDSGYIGFRTGGTNNRMRIMSNGDVYVGSSLVHSSDRKLKTNIENLNYGLNEIMNLNPVKFNWKDRADDRKTIGLIAQEVQPFLSELVYENIDQESKETILGVNYEGIIPVLIKAVQELKYESNNLKLELENLKK